MALERFGLGVLITADENQFLNAMSRSDAALARFTKTASSSAQLSGGMTSQFGVAAATMSAGAYQMNAGLTRLQSGLMYTALGFAPLTAAMASGFGEAAKFEQQMSVVNSKIADASSEDMRRLSDEAQRMGIVSVFSATQAAEGMQYLAQAGANTDEIIASLQGTMNMAAAEGMGLGRAADVVAMIIKGMGMEWNEAAHVADVLALASSKVATNINQMAESFKYGQLSAKQMGMDVNETTAVFSMLADKGLKGSTAGTAFMNMVNKMTKPTRRGREIMSQFGVTLEDSSGKFLKISQIVEQFKNKLNALKSDTQRANYITELFGVRGARAYNALATSGRQAIDEMEIDLINASQGIGAAAVMAEKRLDNFLGKLVLLKSSVQGLAIVMFEPILDSLTPVVSGAVEKLNAVLFSIKEISKAAFDMAKFDMTKEINGLNEQLNTLFSKPETDWDAIGLAKDESALRVLENQMRMTNTLEKLEKKYGKTTVQIALGVRDAIEEVRSVIQTLISKVREVAGWFGQTFGPANTRNIVKWGVTIAMLVAAVTPLIISAMVLGYTFKGLTTIMSGLRIAASGAFTIIKGGLMALSSAFLPILAAVAVLGGAFLLFRQRGESVEETFDRLIDTGKRFYGMFEYLSMIFAGGFLNRWKEIKEGVQQRWREMIAFVYDRIGGTLKKIGDKLSVFGSRIADVLGLDGDISISSVFKEGAKSADRLSNSLKSLAGFLESAADAFSSVIDTAWSLVEGPLEILMDFIEGFASKSDGMLAQFETLWETMKQGWKDLVFEIKHAWGEITNSFNLFTSTTLGDFSTFSKTIGEITAVMAQTVTSIINNFIPFFTGIFGSALNIVSVFASNTGRIFLEMTGGLVSIFEGDLLTAFKRIGIAILNAVTLPLRIILSSVLKLIQSIPGADMLAFKMGVDLDSVKKWIDEGLTSKELETKIAAQDAAGKKEREQEEYYSQLLETEGRIAKLNKEAKDAMRGEIKESDKEWANSRIMDLRNRINERREKMASPTLNATLEDKRSLDINNTICIDGEAVNIGTAKHKQEIYERSGFKNTPWQRRMIAEHGVQLK